MICQFALPSAHAPVAGMRKIVLGASGPSPAIACTDSPAPGWRPAAPCSQSMTTQERCGEAEAATTLCGLLFGMEMADDMAGDGVGGSGEKVYEGDL